MLSQLEALEQQGLAELPPGSFHSLQDDWQLEIQAMFDQLRAREKVRRPPGVSQLPPVTSRYPPSIPW